MWSLGILLSVTCVVIYGHEQCRTPLGNAGRCVRLSECASLKAISSKPRMTAEEILYMQHICCGLHDENETKVCCPPTQENLKTQREPTTKPGLISKELDSGSCPQTVEPPHPDSLCCGIEVSSSFRITGGAALGVEQYPWLALLQYEDGATACGGSLISSWFVLTAAHCLGITHSHGIAKVVRLAEYNTSSFPTDFVETPGRGVDSITALLVPIARQVPHPYYVRRDINRWHDIGLIKLSFAVPYTDFIRPICLPTSDITTGSPDLKFWVAGWGHDGTRFSEIKQHVALPYVPQRECRAIYDDPKTQTMLSSRQLCAGGERGKDSCFGDSGGPMVYERAGTFELVGVISYGHDDCGAEGKPAVYTHVYPYLAWIKAEMKN